MFTDRAIDDCARSVRTLLGQLPHGHAGPVSGDPVHALEFAIDRRGRSLIGPVLSGVNSGAAVPAASALVAAFVCSVLIASPRPFRRAMVAHRLGQSQHTRT
jgi:hypothetical protein